MVNSYQILDFTPVSGGDHKLVGIGVGLKLAKTTDMPVLVDLVVVVDFNRPTDQPTILVVPSPKCI